MCALTMDGVILYVVPDFFLLRHWEIETQKGLVTFPGSHSSQGLEPRFQAPAHRRLRSPFSLPLPAVS